MDGMGSVAMWGASRALDLLATLDTGRPEELLEEQNVYNAIAAAQQRASSSDDIKAGRTVNILLLGAADIRHVIKTMSRVQRHRHCGRIRFYVLEGQTTVLARHLLLLSTLFDQPSEVSVLERAQLFLELYGNGLIRGRSASYVCDQAKHLTRLVTDQTGCLSGLVRFDRLKFRERDDLESVFKFWQQTEGSRGHKVFDIVKLWTYRMQKLLGNRYDSRENIMDWDYNMKIRDKTSLITRAEYVRWRLHAIAFEIRASTYSHPNRTLASVEGLKERGVTVTKWGYFGDICNSPYLAFGIDCEDKDMLKTRNDVPSHTSQEISERNVAAIVHELLTDAPYKPDDPSHQSTAVPDLSGESIQTHLKPFEIHLLPCDPSVVFETKRQQFSQLFDIAFVGVSFTHRLKDLPALMAPVPDACAVVETARFLQDLSKTQAAAFVDKIQEMASGCGFILDQSVHKQRTASMLAHNCDVLVYRRTAEDAPTIDTVTTAHE
ncbi:hypothetical protein RI367_007219 [Sorochytrium milnesiophthora]